MKKEYVIVPFISVGNIKFGMTQEEIEAFEGKPKNTTNDPIMGEIREEREYFEIVYIRKKVAEIRFSDAMKMKELNLSYQNLDLTESSNLIESLSSINKSKPSKEVKKCINFYGLGFSLLGYRNKTLTGREITFFAKNRLEFYELYLIA
jgi:hypothetical protein